MFKPIVFITAIIALSACAPDDGSVLTLYRNSVTDENLRLHVASFDANVSESYNRENCEQAKTLFQNQLGVKVKFWCEEGRFKK